MRLAVLATVLLAASVLVVSNACSQGASSTCADSVGSAATCTSSVAVKTKTSIDRQTLLGATIQACRNGACSTGAVQDIPTDGGQSVQVLLQGSVAAKAVITENSGDAAFHIEVDFDLEDQTIHDGQDTYDLRIDRDPNANVSGTAHYQNVNPGDCPPVCDQATIVGAGGA